MLIFVNAACAINLLACLLLWSSTAARRLRVEAMQPCHKYSLPVVSVLVMLMTVVYRNVDDFQAQVDKKPYSDTHITTRIPNYEVLKWSDVNEATQLGP
jgi:hypothetical protein